MLSFLLWLGMPATLILVGGYRMNWFGLRKRLGGRTGYDDGVLPLILGVILTLLVFILIGVAQMETRAFQYEVADTQATLDAWRGGTDMVDLSQKTYQSMTVLRDIIRINRTLASNQFYNSLWWADCFYNDVVDEIKPVR